MSRNGPLPVMSALTNIGRFAPSPTGPLHFGSLASALASYLQARQGNGQWLVRMEDLDPPREVSGASDEILQQLDNHGLHWDGSVLYQSNRLESYREALESLSDLGLVYHCQCNRQRISALRGIYDGHCRDLRLGKVDSATRLTIRDRETTISFVDQIMGPYQQQLSSEVGDFVLQRRDKLFSYQLAVVVDDQFQSVNQVMRGADLLDSTPRQIYLQQSLGYQQPEYAHLPLALNSEGQKLSKQNHAVSLQAGKESENLWQALNWLRQKPPKELQYQSVNEILVWAMSHWDVQRLGHQLGVRPENTAVPEGY